MPEIHVDEEAIERLDALREDGEDDDDTIIDELVDVYEAEEMTLFRPGDVE